MHVPLKQNSHTVATSARLSKYAQPQILDISTRLFFKRGETSFSRLTPIQIQCLLLQFPSLEALEACLQACLTCFCSNFHGLATLEFKTCMRPLQVQPYLVLHARRGLAQASPRPHRASKRLDCMLWKIRDLLRQHNRKKCCHNQDKKVQEASFGVSFLHLKRSWASLVRAFIANSILVCEGLMCFYNGTAQQEGAWVDLKVGPSRRHQINLLRVSFGQPCKRNVFQKEVRKWTHLKSKVVP